VKYERGVSIKFLTSHTVSGPLAALYILVSGFASTHVNSRNRSAQGPIIGRHQPGDEQSDWRRALGRYFEPSRYLKIVHTWFGPIAARHASDFPLVIAREPSRVPMH
jgi:hypothetical protein